MEKMPFERKRQTMRVILGEKFGAETDPVLAILDWCGRSF